MTSAGSSLLLLWQCGLELVQRFQRLARPADGDPCAAVAAWAAVAVAHGLNPNVVRKWLSGQNVKRMGTSMPATAQRVPPVQFVAVELAKPEHPLAPQPGAQPDIRIELQRSGLQLKLRCAAADGPAHAALLRALADTVAAP